MGVAEAKPSVGPQRKSRISGAGTLGGRYNPNDSYGEQNTKGRRKENGSLLRRFVCLAGASAWANGPLEAESPADPFAPAIAATWLCSTEAKPQGEVQRRLLFVLSVTCHLC